MPKGVSVGLLVDTELLGRGKDGAEVPVPRGSVMVVEERGRVVRFGRVLRLHEGAPPSRVLRPLEAAALVGQGRLQVCMQGEGDERRVLSVTELYAHLSSEELLMLGPLQRRLDADEELSMSVLCPDDDLGAALLRLGEGSSVAVEGVPGVYSWRELPPIDGDLGGSCH
jgi:hypothetical protein